MTVELVREQTGARIDPSFQIAVLVSLLGLTVTLALVPLLGGDFGAWLALAG